MRLTPVSLPPALRPFIHAMWVFESPVGLPPGDARLVAPNGRPKLIIPLENALTAQAMGARHAFAERQPLLVGVWDAPVVIGSGPRATTTVGVEFTTTGLHRFVATPLSSLTREITPLDDVIDGAARVWARRLGAATSARDAVDLVIAFLSERLAVLDRQGPSLVDHAMGLMKTSGFSLEVQSLEQRLGYSRRHLSALFLKEIGMGPKRLSGVLRFERLYRRFQTHGSAARLRDEALEQYYDQSHFIRHFKQLTGQSPEQFAKTDNRFGRLFYT